jgi:hypothetical protein
MRQAAPARRHQRRLAINPRLRRRHNLNPVQAVHHPAHQRAGHQLARPAVQHQKVALVLVLVVDREVALVLVLVVDREVALDLDQRLVPAVRPADVVVL